MSHAPTDGRPRSIEPAALEELRQFDDTGDLLGELIDIFLDDTPQRVQALVEAVAGSDADGLRHSAHALKSSAAQLGALHLSDLCRNLEDLGRAGSLTGAGKLVSEALAEFPRVRTALLAIKAGG